MTQGVARTVMWAWGKDFLIAAKEGIIITVSPTQFVDLTSIFLIASGEILCLDLTFNFFKLDCYYSATKARSHQDYRVSHFFCVLVT